MAPTPAARHAGDAAPAKRAADRPVKGRRPRQQNPKSHMSVRLDDATVARGEAVRQRLSRPWREALVNETYSMLLLVGIAAGDALEREGRSLKDATLVRPLESRGGNNHAPVLVDEATMARIEEARAKLSSEWRQATPTDAMRLFLFLGLDHVEAIRGKNLQEKLPKLFASLRARGRAGGSST